MIGVFSRNARTKLLDLRKVKEAVDKAVPYPYLTQCGVLYRKHPDGREYVDWEDWRAAVSRLRLAKRKSEVEFGDMLNTDLGPTAESCEAFLREKL